MALETTSPPPFLILGPGGSGISTALDIFSDFGYTTVAGVDPQQAHNTIVPLLTGTLPVAFSIKLQPNQDASLVADAVASLKQSLPNLKILTLDAPQEVIIQRYLDSDKKHAFETPDHAGLQSAVDAEKKQFAPLKETKDYSIDTSTTTPTELRNKIAKVLGLPQKNQEFTVYINTFGFKYGAPQDAELMFDMRFMTNPFYDEALRPLNGRDKAIRDFIFNLDHAREFFDRWAALVAGMLPLYQEQGKTRLTIAVGCTGGKHRSVCMGEALAAYLKEHCSSFNVVITHREMLRWGSPTVPNTQAARDLTQAPPCPVGDTP